MFFWVPWYCFRHPAKDGTVFFSNDLNLLSASILWKKLFRHTYIVSDWHELSGTWKDRFVARRSTLCICTTQHLAQNLIAATGTKKPVEAIYGGVDMSAFALPPIPRSALALPDAATLVGYVGYFTTHGYEKGLRTLIDSMQYVEDAHVVLVGARGSERDEYAAYAEQRVPGRFHIVDAQTFTRATAYERVMDVLVIPYPDEPHFREYGFPMKTYEYIAAGKPIVYSNLPILMEVLEKRGVPFSPGDAKDLARAIRTAISTPASPDSARKEYSWDAKAARIVAAIQSHI